MLANRSLKLPNFTKRNQDNIQWLAVLKGIKDLENLDSFVSVNPLEHDDTIECLQDYNSLQASEESTVYFVYQKEVLK